MDRFKLIQEMRKLEYKDLLLNNSFFNTTFKTISTCEMDEEHIIKIISLLCERISELEKDLEKKIVNRTIDLKEYLSEENIKELKNKLL